MDLCFSNKGWDIRKVIGGGGGGGYVWVGGQSTNFCASKKLHKN